jgi:hypothetical protein
MVQMTVFFILVAGLAVAGEFAVEFLSRRYGWGDTAYYLSRAGFWWCFAAGLAAWLVVQLRKIQAVNKGDGSPGTNQLKPLGHALSIAGTQLSMFAWLIAIAYRVQDLVTAVILTGLMIAMGIWNFKSVRAQNGSAVSQAVIQQMALYGFIVLMVFNLRLDVWMAFARGVGVVEIHTLFSPWIIPALSLVLVGWIAFVWLITKPRAGAAN